MESLEILEMTDELLSKTTLLDPLIYRLSGDATKQIYLQGILDDISRDVENCRNQFALMTKEYRQHLSPVLREGMPLDEAQAVRSLRAAMDRYLFSRCFATTKEQVRRFSF